MVSFFPPATISISKLVSRAQMKFHSFLLQFVIVEKSNFKLPYKNHIVAENLVAKAGKRSGTHVLGGPLLRRS
jgi:hypothetical protein